MENIENNYQKGISTNAYLNLERLLFYSSIGTNTVNIFKEFSNEVEISLLGFSSVALFAYFFMKCSNNTKTDYVYNRF